MTPRGSNVFVHDDFEKICASASLGKASAEDLAKLELHVLECSSCWDTYHKYVSVAAYEFATAAHDPWLSLKEANECLDSELFVRRWLDRAAREGIAFSEEVRHPVLCGQKGSISLSQLMRRGQFSLPLAAAILLVLALTTGYLYWKSPANPLLTKLPFQHRSPADTAKLSVGQEATNQSLQSSIDRVNRELDESEDRLRVTEARDHDAITQARRDIDEQRSVFQSQALQLQTQLLEGKKELAQLQALAVNAQREADEQVKRADDLETNLAVARTELSDTTALLKDESTSLARERELLARGRDITDLMGARNLHILDVVDTDPRGKTRPAFGRIFFTEGKSLVFYAYDLNEAKMQKANYQYQVWAKKEGPNRPVRRLGIFYSDDKAQNRWVFKCDDANVINEIDSVFVTLGRPNSDPNRPGAPLMYAYLHGAPNHP